MPLTKRGRRVLASMRRTYGSTKKAESVMHAMANSGRLKGIDRKRRKKR